MGLLRPLSFGENVDECARQKNEINEIMGNHVNVDPIDSGMTLARHVNHISGVCFYSSSDNCESAVRRSLTSYAAHALVRVLKHTRIDYCNGLLASCPRYLIDKLQVVLRAAAKLVLQLP